MIVVNVSAAPVHGGLDSQIHISQKEHITRTDSAHGVGAKRPIVAQVAMQVPRPTLQAMMAGGAATMVTPKVNPAAA